MDWRFPIHRVIQGTCHHHRGGPPGRTPPAMRRHALRQPHHRCQTADLHGQMPVNGLHTVHLEAICPNALWRAVRRHPVDMRSWANMDETDPTPTGLDPHIPAGAFCRSRPNCGRRQPMPPHMASGASFASTGSPWSISPRRLLNTMLMYWVSPTPRIPNVSSHEKP